MTSTWASAASELSGGRASSSWVVSHSVSSSLSNGAANRSSRSSLCGRQRLSQIPTHSLGLTGPSPSLTNGEEWRICSLAVIAVDLPENCDNRIYISKVYFPSMFLQNIKKQNIS